MCKLNNGDIMQIVLGMKMLKSIGKDELNVGKLMLMQMIDGRSIDLGQDMIMKRMSKMFD